MFDLRIPASMAALPGRTHTIADDGEPLSAHAKRMEQMRAYYYTHRERIRAQRNAKYAAMTADKRELRLQKMRATSKRLNDAFNARRAARRAAR